MNNLFDKYLIVLIDKDGMVFGPEKEENKVCISHNDAYSKLPELLDKMSESELEIFSKSTGGYEKGNLLAAKGLVVIWPSDINNKDFIITSLPEMLTIKQKDALDLLLDSLKCDENSKYFITRNLFKNIRSSKVKTGHIAENLDYDDYHEKMSEIVCLNHLFISEENIIALCDKFMSDDLSKGYKLLLLNPHNGKRIFINAYDENDNGLNNYLLKKYI